MSTNNTRTLADITTTVETGRKMTDARNALVAFAVVIEGIKQTTVVGSTGVDKGDVSRVVKQANSNPEALAALKTMSRKGSPAERIAAAAVVGERFLRRPARPAPVKSAPQGDKSGGTDTGSRNPATGPLATDAPVQSARDILAALAVLRDAARSIKWTDVESADLASIALQFADIAAAD